MPKACAPNSTQENRYETTHAVPPVLVLFTGRGRETEHPLVRRRRHVGQLLVLRRSGSRRRTSTGWPARGRGSPGRSSPRRSARRAARRSSPACTRRPSARITTAAAAARRRSTCPTASCRCPCCSSRPATTPASAGPAPNAPAKPATAASARPTTTSSGTPKMYDGNDWAGRKPGQPFFMQVQLPGGKLPRRWPTAVRDGRPRAQRARRPPASREDVKLPPTTRATRCCSDDWAATSTPSASPTSTSATSSPGWRRKASSTRRSSSS